jgi:hypothetical protein
LPTVRGRRLQYSSCGGGSSGRRWGQQGPAAPEVKEEGVGHDKMVRRRPRAVLTWEGFRRQRSRSILTTVAALQWGEEGIAARSNGREKGEGGKRATMALGGLYRRCGNGGQWRGSVWRAPHSGPWLASADGRRCATRLTQSRGGEWVTDMWTPGTVTGDSGLI